MEYRAPTRIVVDTHLAPVGKVTLALDAGQVVDTDELPDEQRLIVLRLYRAGKLERVEGSDAPSHLGGGWYRLSNGERVQGRDEAIAAEAALEDRGG